MPKTTIGLQPFQPMGEEALDRTPFCVKLPKPIKEALDGLPPTERGVFARRVITEAVQRELIQGEKDDT